MSRWAALVVRHRWLAAGSALAVLFALIGVFLGAKIGAASSDSLAHNGKAYDTLQGLERGGMPTGALTPVEVLVSSDPARPTAEHLGQIDGVQHALAPTGLAANRDGRSRSRPATKPRRAISPLPGRRAALRVHLDPVTGAARRPRPAAAAPHGRCHRSVFPVAARRRSAARRAGPPGRGR